MEGDREEVCRQLENFIILDDDSKLGDEQILSLG